MDGAGKQRSAMIVIGLLIGGFQAWQAWRNKPVTVTVESPPAIVQPLTLPTTPATEKPAVTPVIPDKVIPAEVPATPPKQPGIIDGPAKVNVGDIAEFKSKAGQSRVWMADPDPGLRTYGDGDQVAIIPTSSPGTFVIFLAYTEDGQARAAKTVLTVEGARPPPAPEVIPEVKPVPPVAPVVKVTAATYVYEKNDTAIPSQVMAGLNRLNREQGIIATAYEIDTKNGLGNVPKQYQVSAAAAVKNGLPALVVMAGDVELRTVKAPTTEQQVMEAAK